MHFEQLQPNIQDPCEVKDGIEVAIETGLPATVKFLNSVWKLSASCSRSYTEPSVRARALELDIEALMNSFRGRNQTMESDEKKIFETLLSELKKAGGLRYADINPTHPIKDRNQAEIHNQYILGDEEENQTLEKLIAR